MTLVNITLDQEEQDFLLGIAGKGDAGLIRPHVILNIAQRILRARDDSPWSNEEDEYIRRSIEGLRHRVPDDTVHFHTEMQSHSGYAEHSHEVRPDPLWVKRSKGS